MPYLNTPWGKAGTASKEDEDFLIKLAKGVAEILANIGSEVDQVLLDESDASFAERLTRDIKAKGYDQLEQLVDGLF